MNNTLTAPGSRGAKGFTLIELMITVAIVALLAAIALPSYKDSVLKGRRAQARTALLDLAQAEERLFTANNKYSEVALGSSAVPGLKTFSGDTLAGAAYLLQATATCPGAAAANMCLVLTAVPQSPDPAVKDLIMYTTGFKDCDGNTTNKKLCWP